MARQRPAFHIWRKQYRATGLTVPNECRYRHARTWHIPYRYLASSDHYAMVVGTNRLVEIRQGTVDRLGCMALAPAGILKPSISSSDFKE